MNAKGRILVMDDVEKWRTLLVRTLERGGYHADAAASSAELKRLLQENFYHLLVLDIRMEDSVPENDSVPKNVEGMEILRELSPMLTTATRVVMLSSYGTPELIREAFRDYDVEDFISKEEFDNLEFLEQVNRIFSGRIRSNFALEILWQEYENAEDAVANLWIGDSQLKKENELRKRVAAELEDLLRRLFYEAASILVRPLTPGISGASVLWVQPFRGQGGTPPVVVKFGGYAQIDLEYKNYKQFVEPYAGGGRITTARSIQRTPLLGGIVYSLMGAAQERIRNFDEFYAHSDLDQIKSVLDDLFFDTCSAWYANRGNLEPLDLTGDYHKLFGDSFTSERLQEAFNQRLKHVQGKAKLQFTELAGDRRFTNPLLAMQGKRLIRSTYKCITHGDFNQSNILIDDVQRTWMIDFLRTGIGHILRDVAELDTVVRIQLLQSGDASLDERLEMEETLLRCHDFSQLNTLISQFPTPNPALRKAYATVVHLRHIAARLVTLNTNADMSEYYIALLYYAVNLIRFYTVPILQREHALLSASLLADSIGL